MEKAVSGWSPGEGRHAVLDLPNHERETAPEGKIETGRAVQEAEAASLLPLQGHHDRVQCAKDNRLGPWWALRLHQGGATGDGEGGQLDSIKSHVQHLEGEIRRLEIEHSKLPPGCLVARIQPEERDVDHARDHSEHQLPQELI